MSVTLLKAESGPENAAISDGWTVVEGTPSMSSWIEYRAPDLTVVAGTWRATPGVFRAEYKFFEYVYMIDGIIEITPDGGETVLVGPGDVFTVDADFKGLWKIVEPVHKRFLLKLK